MPFTGNFNLAQNAHGQLLVHNDDLIDPGSGVDRHRHRDAEIVTWVVAGEIHHDDSSGATGVVRANQVQAMSAGRGVAHREQNPRRTGTIARVIQMWLPPNTQGTEPGYRTADVGEALAGGAPVTVASGIAGRAPLVPIDNDAAALHAARPAAGRSVTFPPAPYAHLFVVSGRFRFDGAGTAVPGDVAPGGLELGEGDAVRFTRAGAPTVTALTQGGELLYWEMYAAAVAAS